MYLCLTVDDTRGVNQNGSDDSEASDGGEAQLVQCGSGRGDPNLSFPHVQQGRGGGGHQGNCLKLITNSSNLI